MMGTVPWSADAERTTWGKILLDWLGFWLSVLAAILLAWWKEPVTGALMALPAGILASDLLHNQEKLREMLENKPRSTEGLSQWVQLPADAFNVLCWSCGRIVEFEPGDWHANSVDRGGGRFSRVCPCGMGYFKLKKSVTSG
jgi:hypothetical protein